MMTAMAALPGALPLALGSDAGADLRQPLSVATVGGLIVSQMITLFLGQGMGWINATGYLFRSLNSDRRVRSMLGQGRPQAERRKRLAVAPHSRQAQYNIPARVHSRERTLVL